MFGCGSNLYRMEPSPGRSTIQKSPLFEREVFYVGLVWVFMTGLLNSDYSSEFRPSGSLRSWPTPMVSPPLIRFRRYAKARFGHPNMFGCGSNLYRMEPSPGRSTIQKSPLCERGRVLCGISLGIHDRITQFGLLVRISPFGLPTVVAFACGQATARTCTGWNQVLEGVPYKKARSLSGLFCMVHLTGFEPVIPGFVDRCLIQFGHRCLWRALL